MFHALILSFLPFTTDAHLALQRYEIDAANSVVGFDGSSPFHDFTGRTHAVEGDLRSDSEDPARLAGGAVWVDARKLDTGNGSRDDEMRSLLDVEHTPFLVFHLDSVRSAGADAKGELLATGRFSIKGVEKTRVVHFHSTPVDANAALGERELHVQGEVRFPMTEHGIERPGILFAKVADEVRVWMDLRLRPVTSPRVDASVRTLHVEETFVPKDAPSSVQSKKTDERFWHNDSASLWERGPGDSWALSGDHAAVELDPRSGARTPAAEWMTHALTRFAQDDATPWTTSVDEPGGRRTWTVTLDAPTNSSLPSWVLAPATWRNDPEPPAPKKGRR